MNPLRFEWDSAKNLLNRRKHGVSFELAQSVFLDENALLISDPDHSGKDDRFVLLGLSSDVHILAVCHCYRKNDEVIRITSARRAARHERKQYWER